jgi:hypothetical protein
MPNKLLPSVFVLSVIAFNSFAQQSNGSLKGAVTDELGSLVVKARVLARDARGATIAILVQCRTFYASSSQLLVPKVGKE